MRRRGRAAGEVMLLLPPLTLLTGRWAGLAALSPNYPQPPVTSLRRSARRSSSSPGRPPCPRPPSEPLVRTTVVSFRSRGRPADFGILCRSPKLFVFRVRNLISTVAFFTESNFMYVAMTVIAHRQNMALYILMISIIMSVLHGVRYATIKSRRNENRTDGCVSTEIVPSSTSVPMQKQST